MYAKGAAVLGLLCLLIVVGVFLASWQLHLNRHVWTPDGEIYLRMTLQDRGFPADAALKDANRFMLGEIDRGNPYALRDLYSEHPPQFWVDQFELFRNRPLYPFLSSLLYPAFGPVSLQIVSMGAYVLAIAVMFALLHSITSPVRAALGAAVFGMEPTVLNLAAQPFTDELALLFWVCALYAIVAYQLRPTRLALGAVCFASIALALTRPAFFLPLGAAIGAYYAMRRSSGTRTAAAPLLAAVPGALVYVIYSASVHGPSALAQLHWQYVSEQATHGFGAEHGPIGWYIRALVKSAKNALMIGVPGLGGLTLLLLALPGARSWRESGAVRIAVVSALTILAVVFVNPIDVERPLIVPLAPLIVILAVVFLQRFRLRGPAGAGSGAPSA